MLKDTIYIFQFQDPVEKEPSNFDWSLDMDEVEQNSIILGYEETINDKDNEQNRTAHTDKREKI